MPTPSTFLLQTVYERDERDVTLLAHLLVDSQTRPSQRPTCKLTRQTTKMNLWGVRGVERSWVIDHGVPETSHDCGGMLRARLSKGLCPCGCLI